jgi:hypothetical protein
MIRTWTRTSTTRTRPWAGCPIRCWTWVIPATSTRAQWVGRAAPGRRRARVHPRPPARKPGGLARRGARRPKGAHGAVPKPPQDGAERKRPAAQERPAARKSRAGNLAALPGKNDRARNGRPPNARRTGPRRSGRRRSGPPRGVRPPVRARPAKEQKRERAGAKRLDEARAGARAGPSFDHASCWSALAIRRARGGCSGG